MLLDLCEEHHWCNSFQGNNSCTKLMGKIFGRRLNCLLIKRRLGIYILPVLFNFCYFSADIRPSGKNIGRNVLLTACAQII